MDIIDERLVSLLRHDGRRSVSDLALDLGLSRATVRSRIARLIERGDVLGFSVLLRMDANEDAVRAIMLIEVEGKASDIVTRKIYGLPQVKSIHTTNGRWDLIAEIGAASLEEFDEVLRKVRLFEGITASETNLLLASRKQAPRPRAGQS